MSGRIGVVWRRFMGMAKLALASLFAAGLACSAAAMDMSGAGATFPYPLYAAWGKAYKAETGVGLNYQSIGSGSGIKQIKDRAVTFGASDAPLPGRELSDAGLIQFPTVMGGIVPVVNLEGFKPGELVLDGPTLAAVFLGKIRRWNDPVLARLNPGAPLPAAPIALVHRSDGSGTTYNFTYYLSDVSPAWKTNVGTNTAVQWPGGSGAKGNEGVAEMVARTAGSIGYVEYAYARQNKLTFTRMVNRAGKAVAPTVEAFQAAAANADWKSQPGYGVILANQPGDASWPMTAATFILMPRTPADIGAAREVLRFFHWTYAKGQGMALALDYVPMPTRVIGDIEKDWGTLKDANGHPIFTAAP
jgi:phosphate transport system substrate-binding protein